MAKKPETVFQEKVLKRLKLYGKRVWVTKLSQITKVGDPDLILCVCGTMFAWELKVLPNKVTAIQAKTLQDISNACGIARVVYPENLDEALAELESYLIESENH